MYIWCPSDAKTPDLFFFFFALLLLILYQLCGLRCIKINIRVTHWPLLGFCGDPVMGVRCVPEWREELRGGEVELMMWAAVWWSETKVTAFQQAAGSTCLPEACANACWLERARNCSWNESCKCTRETCMFMEINLLSQALISDDPHGGCTHLIHGECWHEQHRSLTIKRRGGRIWWRVCMMVSWGRTYRGNISWHQQSS